MDKKYKIVFIDLDDTLLNKENKVGEYDKEVLKTLKDQVYIVLSSGRKADNICKTANEFDNIKEDSYSIAYNGALVFNNTQSKFIYEKAIKEEIFYKLRDWLIHIKDIEVLAYCRDDKYVVDDNIFKDGYKSVYKVAILGNEQNTPEILKSIPNDLKEDLHLNIITNTKFEFGEKGVTKGNAAWHLLKHLHISPNEAIDIGDGYNDIEIMKLSGLGIAMGNAVEELKECADIITDTNTNNGVGKALNTVFNLKLDKKEVNKLNNEQNEKLNM